ncbi:MAG: hypothetical protein ACRC6I_16740 [Paracoccaceae bacterium]
MRIALLTCLVALPGAALAQDHPPPEFFAGHYELIGQGASGPQHDRLRLTPSGAALVLTSCGMGEGTMTIDTKGEGPFTSLRLGDRAFDCQYFIDWGNYALLACTDDAGSKITLWPTGQGAQESLTCPP